MNDTTPGPGHNIFADPDAIRDELLQAQAALIARVDDLLAAYRRAPASVDNDDDARKSTDFVKQLMACVKDAEGKRVASKEPYRIGGAAVDGFYKALQEPLVKAKRDIEGRLDIYHERQESAERLRREKEARKAREEAERVAAEARQRQEELDRRAAERAKQEGDKQEDEKALREAVEAEEAAKQATEKAQRRAREAAAKPAELSRTRGDLGAVGSRRADWVHDEGALDRATLDLEALRQHIPVAALHSAVRSFIKAGGRELRGVRIYERKHTVVS